ncbi:hypothetical protein SRHO_G00172680 [Serrasalmus rhombeus]
MSSCWRFPFSSRVRTSKLRADTPPHHDPRRVRLRMSSNGEAVDANTALGLCVAGQARRSARSEHQALVLLRARSSASEGPRGGRRQRSHGAFLTSRASPKHNISTRAPNPAPRATHRFMELEPDHHERLVARWAGHFVTARADLRIYFCSERAAPRSRTQTRPVTRKDTKNTAEIMCAAAAGNSARTVGCPADFLAQIRAQMSVSALDLTQNLWGRSVMALIPHHKQALVKELH